MTTGRDWSKIGEIVGQIRKQGLRLKEGPSERRRKGTARVNEAGV